MRRIVDAMFGDDALASSGRSHDDEFREEREEMRRMREQREQEP